MNEVSQDDAVLLADVPALDFARPANEQIAGALRAAILSMRLAPGQMIPEAGIARLFGASRTPVREALALLRDEGLIVTWPSRGTFVSRLSVGQIRGAQFLREALELSVADRLCRDGLAETARAALTANIDDQRRAIAQGDVGGFQLADDRFHALLAEATDLDRIGAVLTREKAVLDRLRFLSLQDADHRARLLADHEEILAAVLAGDAPAATARLRAHLRRVLEALDTLVAANRGYFDTGAN